MSIVAIANEQTTGRDNGLDAVIARAREGDGAAFERLYREHAGRVYALCLRLTADPAEAETLTQDVFVRVWRKVKTFQGKGPFGAWLRRLTVNLFIEQRRSASPRSRWLELDAEDENPAVVRAGAAPAGRPDLALDLERAVAGLPPGARAVFVLHDVEGYRHREIAAMTGTAEGTIKAQLHRARKLLRRSLTGAAGEGGGR